MNTWTPIFSKIVDSSLWSEPDHVCKVFITLLAKKDADQVSRMTAYAIGNKCWPGDPEGEVRAMDALMILSAPDTKRVEPQPHEGRRIERVEDGWLILNGLYYEEMMRKLNRREYKRDKQAQYRAKNSPRAREQRYVKALESGEQEKADQIASEGIPEPVPPPSACSIQDQLKRRRAEAGLATPP